MRASHRCPSPAGTTLPDRRQSATMWIVECLERFPEETERWTGQRMDLARVEREVSEVLSQGKVGAAQVEAIENSPGWEYPRWWPRLSRSFGEPLTIPSDLSKPKVKSGFVEALYGKFNHIEVVSVVARFACPEEFGILSPPVTILLSLTPAERHVPYYCRYLEILGDMRAH